MDKSRVEQKRKTENLFIVFRVVESILITFHCAHLMIVWKALGRKFSPQLENSTEC